MSGLDDLRLAEPIDIIEAWAGGVMRHSDPKGYARQSVASTPIPEGLSDPTFLTRPKDRTDRWVWSRARDISNPAAMRDLKEYLFAHGLALPREVSAAWARTMEVTQWAQSIRVVFEESLVRHSEEARSLDELWGLVINDLEADPHHVATFSP